MINSDRPAIYGSAQKLHETADTSNDRHKIPIDDRDSSHFHDLIKNAVPKAEAQADDPREVSANHILDEDKAKRSGSTDASSSGYHHNVVSLAFPKPSESAGVEIAIKKAERGYGSSTRQS